MLLFASVIFLSYSHADQAAADKLRSQISTRGCAVVSDALIRPGDDWTVAIERMIDRADTVIVLLSQHPPSIHVRAEYLRALRKRKRIIPVLADPAADIPIPLEPLHRLPLVEAARQACHTER